MTRIAPLSTRPPIQEAFSRFVDRGVAVFSPDSGSVFKHVGVDALDLLHRISTNALIDMPDGSARQTVLTTEKGRIIDAPWVIRHASDDLTLISDSPDPSAMRAGILRYTIIEDAELIDITHGRSRLMVFGDNATETILEVLPEAIPASTDIAEFLIVDSGSQHETIAIRTDAAGKPTWLIVSSAEMVDEILSRFGYLDLQLVPRSLFEYVRVSNCVPIAGSELNGSVNPLEAGLNHLIDFEKGCYVGQEVIARLDTYSKVQRVMVGLDVIATANSPATRIAPQDGVQAPEGSRDIGWISSVATRPETGRQIGLGFVRNAYAADGHILETSGGSQIELRVGKDTR